MDFSVLEAFVARFFIRGEGIQLEDCRLKIETDNPSFQMIIRDQSKNEAEKGWEHPIPYKLHSMADSQSKPAYPNGNPIFLKIH